MRGMNDNPWTNRAVDTALDMYRMMRGTDWLADLPHAWDLLPPAVASSHDPALIVSVMTALDSAYRAGQAA